MRLYQPSRLQKLALKKMAATIRAAMLKKAPELFGGAPKSRTDVDATYLPKLVDMSDPFPQACWFGAKIKETGMAIVFETMEDVEIEEATAAIIAQPASAWTAQGLKPLAYMALAEGGA